MIRNAVLAALGYWREAVAAIVPFALLLPLLILSADWVSISMQWFKAGTMKSIVNILGPGFITVFFGLPIYGVSFGVGLILGMAKARCALRLACVFGTCMFIAWTVPALLLDRIDWYLCLFNVPLVVLPVAATAVWLRAFPVKVPGCCVNCGYNLTGNVSGRCSECGVELDERYSNERN